MTEINVGPEPASDLRPAIVGKTFVLIHGGYHGGWCWKAVALLLRSLGHEVHVPTLTGLGERSHLIAFKPTMETWITDVAQLIHYEDLTDVVLVGHSFAGSVISALADRMPSRLRHLIYLDAQVLQSGESAATRSPERVREYQAQAMAFSAGLSIPPVDPHYFGIVDPVIARWITAKLTPHPLQTYLDELHLEFPVGNGLTATYIACSRPYFANTEGARMLAKSTPGWSYEEIATGHDAMLLAPEVLTAMLVMAGE